MTKILEDLEIFYQVRDNRFLGTFGYASIDNHEGYYIMVNKGLELSLLVEAICHELEYYDIVKAVYNIRALGNETHLALRKRKDGVLVDSIPEWAHSNPSYYPHDEKT